MAESRTAGRVPGRRVEGLPGGGAAASPSEGAATRGVEVSEGAVNPLPRP